MVRDFNMQSIGESLLQELDTKYQTLAAVLPNSFV
jgi:hypothetical protein